jgi:ABC-type multidrug transport system fused ATPase/permease subunit
MKKDAVPKIVWSLLTGSERKGALMLGAHLFIGTAMEVISVGALVPLIQVLTQSNLQSKYPLIDRMFPNSSDSFIISVILAGVVLVFLFKEIFLGFSLWMQRGLIARIETRFQTELFDRYTNQPYEFHLTNNSALLSRNILNSSNFITNVLDPIFILLTDGFVTIALCVVLVVIEPIAMFVTICSVGAVAAVFHSFSKRRIEQWGIERQVKDGVKLQQMNETFGGMREILVTGRGNHFRTRFSSNIGRLSHINRKFTTLLGIPRLYLEFLSVAGLAALVLSLLALGRTSESLLPVLALFAGGAFRLMPAINRITFAVQSLQMGRPIVESLHAGDLGNRQVENIGVDAQYFSFQHSINFLDVSYEYPNTNERSLNKVNIEIKKGSEVGIIGTTGAGKSTLVDVLLGLLPPTEGVVTVDGLDISRNIRGWQALVGYVPQTIFLSDSTIRSNIAFGVNEDEIDDEKVLHALSMAQLKDFVFTLPEGMNTFVGERGVRLSGGQRQRIGIARALYTDPPVLVFDEATSALDIETEREVMNSLDYLRASKTIVIVTHRVSALEHCDQTIEVSGGQVL